VSTPGRRDPARTGRLVLRALFLLLVAAVVAALVALGVPASWRLPELAPEVARDRGVVITETSVAPGALALPRRGGSVRFAVIGDSGRGDGPQHEVAAQMVAWRERFPFEFVLMLGDNIYDSHTPEDYRRKFEEPYAPLLAAGVTFYASIGNHDDPAQIHYAPFNMGGRRYYTFRKPGGPLGSLTGAGAQFFALDSRSLDPTQLAWLRAELTRSTMAWKIVFFHHPIYTSGRYRAGARALRLALEPVLVAGNADVVLAGHEHLYERVQPQRGIAYFTSGAAGSLRRDDLAPSAIMAKGFDEDYSFMLMEIEGDALHFQAISRTGETVDAGTVTRAPGGGADQ
jgi:hypothetical protein